MFMASSVIISNIFRSTRSYKRQLPAKNVNGNASVTDERDISAPEPGFDEFNSKPADITYNHNKFATEKKTIIICDDEPDVLLSFELLLKSKYNVIMVDSGKECNKKCIEELYGGNKIHLILLDYKLDGMMGDSVARKIKEYTETKIILISAYNIDDELVKELENGGYISKYILKPIETDRLTDLIDAIVVN